MNRWQLLLASPTPWSTVPARGLADGYAGPVRAVTNSTRGFARAKGASDADLVLAARAGEAWASEALFRRHASLVNGLALRLVGRDGDVDDVVQDAFVTAFGSLASLKDPQAFAAWLGSIVVRKAGRLLRRRRVLRALGLGGGAAPVDVDALVSRDASPADVAELKGLYALVEALPVSVRIPFLLRRVEGYALEEIAELTRCSLATTKRRIAEGEASLARVVGERKERP